MKLWALLYHIQLTPNLLHPAFWFWLSHHVILQLLPHLWLFIINCSLTHSTVTYYIIFIMVKYLTASLTVSWLISTNFNWHNRPAVWSDSPLFSKYSRTKYLMFKHHLYHNYVLRYVRQLHTFVSLSGLNGLCFDMKWYHIQMITLNWIDTCAKGMMLVLSWWQRLLKKAVRFFIGPHTEH